MEKLRQTLKIGDKQMQEATAGDMIHSLWELIEYGSSIITLFPGDVINNGTSGGTGAGTAKRFLKPGEVIEASIDGIGTLTIPVVGEEAPEGQEPPLATRSPARYTRRTEQGPRDPDSGPAGEREGQRLRP